MKDPTLYTICHRMDEPLRVFGLTLEEFIPCVLFVFLGWLIEAFITGMVMALGVVMLLKWAKRGQGSGWLWRLLYWYCPACVSRLFLISLPNSAKQFFLS